MLMSSKNGKKVYTNLKFCKQFFIMFDFTFAIPLKYVFNSQINYFAIYLHLQLTRKSLHFPQLSKKVLYCH